MSIGVILKVSDGIVLAADSATTIVGVDPNGRTQPQTVYNNANKIFNLCKGKGIGAVTCGLGHIGEISVCTLSKDLRERLSGNGAGSTDAGSADWSVGDDYVIGDVACRARHFLFDEHYAPAMQQQGARPSHQIEYIVAGFSHKKLLPEVWQFTIEGNGKCARPEEVMAGSSAGLHVIGVRDAVMRLLMAIDPQRTAPLLLECGASTQVVEVFMNSIAKLVPPFIHPAMPIQDAIDLASFLVETQTAFTRFLPGLNTVGGPTEIATITKHEGFKWIARKYYYAHDINLEA